MLHTHTRGLGTPTASQHIFDSEKLTIFSCAPDGIRTSGLWQLTHPVTSTSRRQWLIDPWPVVFTLSRRSSCRVKVKGLPLQERQPSVLLYIIYDLRGWLDVTNQPSILLVVFSRVCNGSVQGNYMPVQLVQFQMVSMRSGRPIFAPPRSGVSSMLPLKQFQCWSDWRCPFHHSHRRSHVCQSLRKNSQLCFFVVVDLVSENKPRETDAIAILITIFFKIRINWKELMI